MDRHTRSVGAKVLRAVCTPRGTGLHQHTHPCTSRQLCTHENRRALIKCVSVKRCVSPGSVTHTHGCDICTQDTRTDAGSYRYSEAASRFRLPVCTTATFSYPDCGPEDDYLTYIIIF